MTRKPLLNYFSEKELDMILEAAFNVLESSGIYIPHDKAKNLLKKAGAKERTKDYLTIPKDLVKNVLSDVNPRFKLFDQTGTDFLQLEIGNTYYGPGSDLQYIIDLETEKQKKTQITDVAKNITLIDNMPQFDFLMSTGLPFDVASKEVYSEVFKMMVINSNKPIVATATNLPDIKKIHQIATKVAGSEKAFSEKPFFVAYLEPVSPLKIEKDIANRIIYCSEKGVPMLFAAGANIAVQSPGTPEGAVIQGTAESLSGLVLAYLVNPNVKFIFGANSADFDATKGIVSYGGPGWSKTMAYYTEIARKLNLPVWGAAGCTDSNSIDAQAGFEAAMSLLMAELCGATLVHDVGYLSHGDVTDPRGYVFNSELIDRVRWLANRGSVDTAEVIKVIDDVVKGKVGTFLEADHTFKNYRSIYNPKKWIDRNNYSDAQGSLLEKLKNEVHQILKENQPIVDGEIKTKRKKTEKVKERIEVKKQKKKTLEEIFKDNPDKPDVLKEYLQEKLESGEKPGKLYNQLTKSFEKSLEGTDENINLVFLLAYANLFDNAAQPLLAKMENKEEKIPLVIATVESDLHYVGKSIVAQLAGVSGYEVIDKGIDVKTGELIRSVIDNDANLIGLSALLTTTRDNMKKTIKGLKALGMKDQVGVIVGGAVIDEAYASGIEADAYRRNAGEAGEALNEIKDYFIDTYKRKSVKDEEFRVIGESINSINSKVKEILQNKDEKKLLEIAKKQVEKGAKYLDVAVSHVGYLEHQVDAIIWAVQTLQKKFDTPLCLDSDDYRVVEAALKVYDNNKAPALINSATLEKERMENMVRLAAEYKSSIVFQAADGHTIDTKLGIIDQFIEYASKKGIEVDRIFIDPGLETMAHNQGSAKIVLQTISTLKDKYPELHYTIGLTNIGYGLGKMSKTKVLQKTFLNIGKRVGLDSAITHTSILTEEFKDKEKAMCESIEFIAGITSGLDYAKQIDDPAYDTK